MSISCCTRLCSAAIIEMQHFFLAAILKFSVQHSCFQQPMRSPFTLNSMSAPLSGELTVGKMQAACA